MLAIPLHEDCVPIHLPSQSSHTSPNSPSNLPYSSSLYEPTFDIHPSQPKTRSSIQTDLYSSYPLNTTYFIPHSHRHSPLPGFKSTSQDPTCPRTTSGHAADAAAPTISRSARNNAPCVRIESVRDVRLGDLPGCLRHVLRGKGTTCLDMGRLWRKAVVSLMMRPWCLMIIGELELPCG